MNGISILAFIGGVIFTAIGIYFLTGRGDKIVEKVNKVLEEIIKKL